MTEQKPPGKPWETWIEEQIRRAQDEGAFEHLEGAGKPLPGLTEPYDPDWWVKKLLEREQVSVLPPALALLRKVEAELAAIRGRSPRHRFHGLLAAPCLQWPSTTGARS